MIPRRCYERPVFGWPIALAAFVGMFGNVGPLIYASFAFIIQEFESEFGWARSDVTLAISLLTFSSALAHPAFGAVIDRFGVKRPVLVSLALMAGVLASIPLFLHHVWQLWLAFVAVAVLGVANNSLPFIRLAAAWFDKRRGLMMGVIASGTGLGLAALPALTGRIVELAGWRGGFVWYGAFIVLVTIPVMAVFLKDRPSDLGLAPDGRRADADAPARATETAGLAFRGALRTRVFWMLAVAILLASFALWGVTNQLALLLGDRGMSRAEAGGVATALGLSMAASRLGIGWMLDHLFAPLSGAQYFWERRRGFGCSPPAASGGAFMPAAR